MSAYVGILLGMLGISVMQLILAAVMPTVVSEIGGEQLYSWVFAGYMLASLFTIPIFSRLADLYGKKRFYLLGMGLFAAGTFLCGLARSMEQLIGARVVQGLGAGIMIPVSLALVSDLFAGERRGQMIGLFSLVQLVAILISPFLGSFIAARLGWSWVFFITLGLVIIAMLLVALTQLAPTAKRRTHWSEIDLAGGLVFGAFCTLAVGLSSVIGKQQGSVRSTALLLLGTVASALAVFWIESRHPCPIIQVEFLRSSVIRRSIGSSILAGAMMYGLITLLPLFGAAAPYQGSALDGSRILLLFLVGVALGVLISSRLIAVLKNNRLPRATWTMSFLGALAMIYAVTTLSPILFCAVTFVVGLGTGSIMACVLINSQNAVRNEDRTVLSGLVQLGRYLGASVGVTILTGVLPAVGAMSDTVEFVGAFGVLAAMSLAGLINEFV